VKKVNSKEAAQLLREGEILIAALDHVLALICDARNDEAVLRLRQIKQRPDHKGFSILMDSDARTNRYVKDVPALAWDIFDTSTEAPVILILPKGHQLSPHALASDGSIALRRVTNPEEQKLVQTANAPLACTALLSSSGHTIDAIEKADPKVLASLEYVLSLPTAKTPKPQAKIPVIKLGMNGEVQIIRD